MYMRGACEEDRGYRNPKRPSSASLSNIASPAPSGTNALIDLGAPGWDVLPPYTEVVAGVKALTTSYFQLGFLPKNLFFEQLRTDRSSASVFLLCSILSVSARFTPCLVTRYTSGAKATQWFLGHASRMLQENMFSPTLESIQGFFLMSIAEWGNGDKNKSLVYMGIAVRLAGISRMHREDAYDLPDDASREEIVRSEVTRRTFWMLETFENLHSGSDSPVAFSYADVTVLLPSDEQHFTFGIRPAQRAALQGTPPAVQNPELARLPTRSLFATLLQTHNLWGQVARLVSADAASTHVEARVGPDDYARLSQSLVEFERDIPPQHAWSVWNLGGFEVEGLDLAYLSVCMVLRLSNIILRRSYLHDVLGTRQPTGFSPRTDSWATVAEELFNNMLIMDEQIGAFFDHRSPDQGYPALIVFCVYVCGSLANHLQQQPQICPRVAPSAERVLRSSVRGLEDLQSAWPLAKRWYQSLCKATSRASAEATMASPAVQGEMSQEGSIVVTPVGVDVQFNAPILSDAMFDAFDLWSDAIGGVGSFGDALAGAQWEASV